MTKGQAERCRKKHRAIIVVDGHLKSLIKPIDLIEADQGAADGDEGEVEIDAPFVADCEAAKAVQLRSYLGRLGSALHGVDAEISVRPS